MMINLTHFSSLQSSVEGEEEEAEGGGMNPQRVESGQVEVDLVDLEVEDIVHLEVDMVDLVVDLEVEVW